VSFEGDEENAVPFVGAEDAKSLRDTSKEGLIDSDGVFIGETLSMSIEGEKVDTIFAALLP